MFTSSDCTCVCVCVCECVCARKNMAYIVYTRVRSKSYTESSMAFIKPCVES